MDIFLKIEKKDALNTGRMKINESIEGSEDALAKSTDADNKATQALARSESTQTQLNTIVIDGDSSVEAAQARVDEKGVSHSTLKDRIDGGMNSVNTQLEKKAQEEDVVHLKKITSGVRFSELPKPIIIAHRGARNIYPECSLEAYRACVDMGLPIEIDVRVSADGVLVINHDASMNRTTNRSGAVSYYSTAAFKGATITDLGTEFVGTPVTLQDLFIEFGNKAIYIIESKVREVAQPIIDMIIEHSLEDNCLFSSFNRDDLNYSMQKNIPTMILADGGNPQTYKGDGIDYIGVSKNVEESFLQECVAVGLDVWVYTINRRYEYEKFINLGATAIISDDPLWITSKSKPLPRDSFEQLTYYHGQVGLPRLETDAEYILGNRGGFYGKGEYGWVEPDIEGRDFTLQGWVGELDSSFEIKVDIFPKAFNENNRWAAIAFCTPIDYFDDSSSLSSGYNALIRESGYMQIYKRTGEVGVNIGEIMTSPLQLNKKVTLVINVNNSRVKVSRTDTGSNNEEIIVNDTTFRNGYLHLGRRAIGVTFGNIEIN